MQHVRKIMAFGFALVIFTGTIGVNVFTHFCKIEGVDYSYIVPVEHSCAKKQKVESCCHQPAEANKQAEQQAKIDSNCCQEEVASYKISSDYIQKSVPAPVFVFTPVRPLINIFPEIGAFESELLLSAEVTRPPPKTGQEILILHQVFRI